MKWPVDCLVHYGLLIVDSDKYVCWTEIPRQEIDRKNPRVVITLTESEEAD